MNDPGTRAQRLVALASEVAGCERCALAATRTQVVFGTGAPDAELVLVGEAPGFREDQSGVPFAGETGDLVDRLLAGIGLERASVYCVNVLKCRPPGNRDPLVEEIAACEPHLFRQLDLVAPRVVVTLGTFATRLLSGREEGITRVRGQEQTVTLAGRPVTLYPVYHPAAALYTPTMLRVLEQDFARIPALLGGAAVGVPARVTVEAAAGEALPSAAPVRRTLDPEPVQLGLF